ncbi:MAG: DMT family transporter [Pseudomonadota bacterium]
MAERNFIIGLASALLVICIWSGFFVVSRMGATTDLTPFDLAALRFIVAGTVTIPFLWRWWPRHLRWWQVIVLVVTGPGSVYTLLLYSGLESAPAAYAGVFANGSLPIAAILIGAIFARDFPGPWRMFAVSVLFAGGVMVGLRGLANGAEDVRIALTIFVGSSVLLATYIWALPRWGVSPWNALAVINVPNLALFLPLWWFLLPSGIADATQDEVLLQLVFQGLGPGFFAVILFTLAATHLGATATAGFSAAVPAGVALLSVPVLGEALTTFEWIGVAVVTIGLFILVARNR